MLLLALMVLFLVDPDPSGMPGQPSPTPSAEPVQQETLLVQVTLERSRAASLLIATGGDPDQAVLLDLPQDMLLVDGQNYTPLLDANLSLNPRLTTQATQNTLGVRVDGGWRMERKALAGLVDSVGTVSVTVDAPTVFRGHSGAARAEPARGDDRSVRPGCQLVRGGDRPGRG